MLDITYVPEKGILEDFLTLRSELEKYNPSLAKKDQMVLINKVDIHCAEHSDLASMQEALRDLGSDSLPISALTGEGLEELKQRLARKFLDA